MEYITKDTHLDFSTDDGVTYKELYGLNGYPDMGSEPEQKEVTNMRDSNKRYIAGLTDTGNLGFDFYYNKETAEDSGNLVKKTDKQIFSDENTNRGRGRLYWRLYSQ